MKKVRFETPDKSFKVLKMNERECHSPRPLVEKQMNANVPEFYNYPKVLPYTNDPVQLFERSNSSPYPIVNKTNLPVKTGEPNWSPCNDLELSMLDASYHEPRRPTFCRSILKPTAMDGKDIQAPSQNVLHPQSLPYAENKTIKPPNVLIKDNDFFIRRDNLGKINLDIIPVQKQLSKLSLDKENNPLAKKAEIMQMAAINSYETLQSQTITPLNNNCSCHHCVRNIHSPNTMIRDNRTQLNGHITTCLPNLIAQKPSNQNQCPCRLPPPQPNQCSCCNTVPAKQFQCNNCDTQQPNSPQVNAVDKKTWAIEKYEQSKKSDSLEVEKQTNFTKEKREPTVSDLFKIIKLQNEQLQLLQEKVDKFISASQQNNAAPVQNHMTEHVAIETVGNDQHKISIGVMTSFEMVRTSTIINKEVLKTNENAQIQCNRSQISIKEVRSKSQSPNLNFLDGIAPKHTQQTECNGKIVANVTSQAGMNDEKTLNELSLYNVQVDNATTPLMSPEQSLYLDVRDYSDSDTGSDDQSNVGWTYYNKVMTHVNGMLQDSDMPSSASALYRNTRHHMQTLQMQIDKTNVSVTKRVKFGDDPLGLHQPHIYTSTDTSLKMNQLAAKYLKGGAPVAAPQRAPRPTNTPIDMSFATKNYMERHKLLQGVQPTSTSPSPGEMPRFLDITALKQQPKFL